MTATEHFDEHPTSFEKIREISRTHTELEDVWEQWTRVSTQRGVLPNYGECYDNYHIKSIVNTKHTQRSHHSNGHQFIYLNNKTAVDTNFHPVLGAYNPKPGGIPDASLYSVMYLNHYAVKSREDYEDKLVRGVDQRHKKTMKFFNDTNAQKMKQCGYLKMPPAVPIL